MRITVAFVIAISLLWGCANQKAPSTTQKPEARVAPATDSGLGDLHHPVTTSNPEAQKAFNEGLTLAYAFNHDAAIKKFEKARDLDPKLAMAYWGIAYALGPNYNLPVDPAHEVAAYDHIQVAMKLAQSASQVERDYIAAMATRYSKDPGADMAKLDRDYAAAMKQLAAKYPDDLDAATIYAESLMLLRPWRLWTHDGRPEEGTEEIVEKLEYVLARDPDHIGANHLYIHAVEASNDPHRAAESANRLPGLAPAAGHIVHMPAHVYIRTGDYEASGNSNVVAIEADEEFFSANPAAKQDVYAMMYYNHNIHFLAYSRAMEGRYAQAITAADKLADHVRPQVVHLADLEGFMPTPEVILVRFHKWDDALARSEPDRQMKITHLAWTWARGMAFAAKKDIPKAQATLDEFKSEASQIPATAPYSTLNKAREVIAVAEKVLAAKIADSKGDTNAAIALYEQAVALADKLNYSEPPDWMIPPREALGSLLLRANRPADAERVFRSDLEKNPRNGRSLCGLSAALLAQKKSYDAELVKGQFEAAWKNADTQIDPRSL